MSKIVNYVIVENKQVAKETYVLTLKGPTNWIKAGKFFMLKIPGFYLRRPMAPAYYDTKQFSFLYQIVGNGTDKLTTLIPGKKLSLLIDLGNGYQYNKKQGMPLLVAGGAGINPVLCLANELDRQKVKYRMVVGYKNKSYVPHATFLKRLNKHAIICTDDGSYGFKGNVVDVIKKHQ
jgi:dihydroorotate dehydrogenase electron transfer subunit